MERPSTKEREAATLYLTDLNGMKKNGDENSDLLCFYAKVKTFHSKTRSAYTLMDPGASHCYIDSTYTKQLGLPLCHAGCISVITAAIKHPTSERCQVWLEGNICGSAGNCTATMGWYTLFDLKGTYDRIVEKNWHSTTCHMVDAENILHLLDKERLADGRVAFVPKLALIGLRPQQGHYQEVHNHWKTVARMASINLITADETGRSRSKSSKDRILFSIYKSGSWEMNSGKMKLCWQTWVSGESRSNGNSRICFSHQREYHHWENTISVSIWILQ